MMRRKKVSVKVNACQSTEEIIELFRDVGNKPIAKFVYNSDGRHFTNIVCLEMGRISVHIQTYNTESLAVHIDSMLKNLYILVSEISGGLHNWYNIAIFNKLNSPVENHMEIYVGPSNEDYQHYKEAFSKDEQLEYPDSFSLAVQSTVKRHCERLMRLSRTDIDPEHKIECEKAIDFLTEEKEDE